MFDFVSPFLDVYPGTVSTFEAICTDRDWDSVMDYTHINSVSISEYDGNLIVSSHTLGTIFSLYRNGSGLQWVISSTMKHLSDFKFRSSDADFDAQHDVQQTSNGNIIMLDNSYAVSGCQSCSRALELELDFQHQTLDVAWEYIIHEKSILGGSVTVPKNRHDGPYVVGFCKLAGENSAANVSEGGHPSRLYEIYGNGTAASVLEIPAPSSDWSSGSYRIIPSRTIGGEDELVDVPTQAPTTSFPTSSVSPTFLPTSGPTSIPSLVPLPFPTSAPSSPYPSSPPSPSPSSVPFPRPSPAPTISKTLRPTNLPTSRPSPNPSFVPIPSPTLAPSTPPPSISPSLLPSPYPTTPVPSSPPSPPPSTSPTTLAPTSSAPSLAPTDLLR